MEDTRRLLPVVEFNNKEFFVDIENREFRDVNDADSAINMHSQRGREMVVQMQGTEWRRFAVEPGTKGLEV